MAASAVIGHYTLIGDTDFDGQVTPQDYVAIDSNLGSTNVNPGMGWFYGDLDQDGNVTPQDYTAIDSALGLTMGQVPSALTAKALALSDDRAADLLSE